MKVYYKDQPIFLADYRQGWWLKREKDYVVYAEQSGGAHKNIATAVVADLPIATATYRRKGKGLWLITTNSKWYECKINRHRNHLEILVYRNEVTETHITSVLVFEYICRCTLVPPTSFTRHPTPCLECFGADFPYRSLLERALKKVWCYHCKELH